MKFLKIKLLFVFSFLSLFSFAEDLLPWVTDIYNNVSHTKFWYTSTQYFFTKQSAIDALRRYVPCLIEFRSSSQVAGITNRISFVDCLNSYHPTYYPIESNSSYYDFDALSMFMPSEFDTLCLSNIITHESYPTKDVILKNPNASFIDTAHLQFNAIKTSTKSVNPLFTQNCILQYRKFSGTLFVGVMIDYDVFCHNVVNAFKDYDIKFIKENIEYLIPFLISNLNNISNSFDRVLSNSDSISSSVEMINNTLGAFSTQLEDIKTDISYQKLKSYASGSLADFSFGNPDSYAEGPLQILYQLTRQERGEPENLVVTQREAYNYLGLNQQYGSWPSSDDYQRINQILSAQVVAKTESQAKKYQDLYSIADDDGFVTDPDTGEKVSLQDAFKNWNNQKSQGALAAYSYNNPSATNGFFGALKRHLTEESDWRLLDKNFKNKVEQFTDDVKNDGIKIKNGSSPLRVAVQQDVPITVDISKESFDGVVLSTDVKEPLDKLRGSFNSFFELWQVYSGVSDKSSRSWLDLINENNSNYYDFVRDKLYITLSNDLASIVRNTSRTNDFYNSLSNQLERIITSHNVTVAETSPFEIYANQNVSTLQKIIPDAYLLNDERYQSFQGTTNFEQAIIFMLHDQHVIAQNNLKANIMSADYIRGIYHSLYSGSNIAERVDYITNQVFSANSLSTDPDYDYSSAYSSQADELKTHLNEVVTSITEFKSQTLEKLTPIANQIFADYILPSKLTVLQFKGKKFEVDLIKYRTIFDMMHYASSVAWLVIGLLMLPRVIYMLLAFSLKILGKFYNIMRSS